VSEPNLSGMITPSLSIEPVPSVDFSKSNFNITTGYKKFVEIISRADEIIKNITRTDIPYYIFIDELEAYHGENEDFYRDLRMIRDLLFTSKRMNDIFQDGTKLICSVRLEIINSINRFIQPNQLHKIMQGYDERLIWEYTNTNSFKHPIISILLKRIEMSEENMSDSPVFSNDIIKNWFANKVYNLDVCTYILNNTWHKPRDIVRMLLSAQSNNSKNFSVFNQNTFETFMPVYSKQCLVEIKEEMRALYTANEIECIINCLHGFKRIFSLDEIKSRFFKLYPNSKISKDIITVLDDLYRIGIIGNISKNKDCWNYKGQYKLITTDPWEIIIHPALRIELMVSGKTGKYTDDIGGAISEGLNRNDKILLCKDCGSEFKFTVGEQEFYANKGLEEPRRCKKCRIGKRVLYKGICCVCGEEAVVPFKPFEDRPIYCSRCFEESKSMVLL